MEPRLITLDSIIHGNLMPWLAENQDPEKYRLILRKLASDTSGQKNQYFETLPKVLSEMGINAGKKLTDEWVKFSKVPLDPVAPGIINPFVHLPDENPKLLFYTSLVTQSLSAGLSLLAESKVKSNSETLQKYRVMGAMKIISDLIISARALHPDSEADIAIIDRLLAGLAVMFTENWKRYPDAIELSMLRISNADVRNIVTKTVCSDENSRTLFTTLAGRYFPVDGESPKIVSPAFMGEEYQQSLENQNEADSRQTDFKTVLNEVEKTRLEISAMKQALTEAGKKEQTGPETEDRRIGSAEVCAFLNISKSTLKTHRENGDYSFTKIGKRYYYSFNEINNRLRLKKIKKG